MARLIVFIFLAVSLSSVVAATYKWVDENGVVHYSDTLPPKYSDKANTQLNKRGVVIKKTDAALSEAQQKALEQERTKFRDRQAREAEERKRNKLLLDTYTTEEEIELARDRGLEAPEGRIALAKDRIKAIELKRQELEERVALFKERAESGNGKGPPPAMLKTIESLKVQKQRLRNAVAQAEREKTEIAAKFETDKLRFRELKAGGDTALKASIPDKPNETLIQSCFELWRDALISDTKQARAYVIGSEILHHKQPAELILDTRSRNRFGDFATVKISCPLNADGSIDVEGASAKRAKFLANKG